MHKMRSLRTRAVAHALAGVIAVAAVPVWTAVGRPAPANLSDLRFAVAGTPGPPAGAGRPTAPGSAAARVFALRGNAIGLFPGATRALPVVVTNPYRFAIVVRSLAVGVGAPSTACAGTNVVAGTPSLPVTVPALGSVTVPVPLTMQASAPNDCKNATFPLTLSGSATMR